MTDAEIATLKSVIATLTGMLPAVVVTPPVVVPVTPPTSAYPANVTLLAVSGKTATISADLAVVKDKVFIQMPNGRTTSVTDVVLSADGKTQAITTSEPATDSAANEPGLIGKACKITERYPATTTPPVVTVPPVVVTPPVVTTPTTTKGQIFINLGMGAGGDTVLPGTSGTNYGYASDAEIARAVGYGFKRFRVGGLWERFIKPGGKSELYTGAGSSIEELKRVCRTAAANGATVLVEPFHNYAGYSATGTSGDRKIIGTTGAPTPQLYANDLLAVMLALKADSAAWAGVYGVDTMNEWQSIDNATILACHKAVLATVAPQIDKKVIALENNNYSSAVNWVSSGADFSTLVDPRGAGYVEWSAHLYLDQGSSGFYSGDVVSTSDAAAGITTANIGTKRIAPFYAAGKAAGVKMSIGENIVTGNLTNLLVGEANLLSWCVANGVDVYLFGMSDWFGSNLHNIELAVNAPMLAVAQAAMKL